MTDGDWSTNWHSFVADAPSISIGVYPAHTPRHRRCTATKAVEPGAAGAGGVTGQFPGAGGQLASRKSIAGEGWSATEGHTVWLVCPVPLFTERPSE